MNYRNPALLKLARDQACSHCGAEDGTTVAAHSNSNVHGKGASIKSHDCFVAFLCMKCHSWLDQGGGMDPTGMWTVQEKAEMFRRAADKTMLWLWQAGKIKVAR